VFDFEIEVTDKFRGTTARAGLALNLCPGAAQNLHYASPRKALKIYATGLAGKSRTS